MVRLFVIFPSVKLDSTKDVFITIISISIFAFFLAFFFFGARSLEDSLRVL